MEQKNLTNDAKVELFKIYNTLTETQRTNLFSLASCLIQRKPLHAQEQD